MKLLHLVFEGGQNSTDLDFDSRVAFRELLAEGELTELTTFPYYADWLSHNDFKQTQRKIVEQVKKSMPDVLFWQHIKTFPVQDNFFAELRDICPKMYIAYHEGDPYGRSIKKITSSLSTIIRNSDLIFWVGLGHLKDFAVEHGGPKPVYLSPHCFDTDRFWTPWTPTLKRENDVIMIASRGKARLPFRYLPGGRSREKCVDTLTKTFGSRFALFGYGWKKSPSYRGSLPFAEQHNAIRNSWISANWDHFDDINFYSSNRLAISMAAGVPHITSYHKGFEYMYKDLRGGLYFAHSPADVADIACYLLSKPSVELLDEGIKARDYAYEYLRSTVIYRNIVKKIKEHLQNTPLRIN